MYKGMLAFESRAMLNLLQTTVPDTPPIGFGKIEFASALGTIGDGLLAAGQAQMVLGGLVNIGYDIGNPEYMKIINHSNNVLEYFISVKDIFQELSFVYGLLNINPG